MSDAARTSAMMTPRLSCWLSNINVSTWCAAPASRRRVAGPDAWSLRSRKLLDNERPDGRWRLVRAQAVAVVMLRLLSIGTPRPGRALSLISWRRFRGLVLLSIRIKSGYLALLLVQEQTFALLYIRPFARCSAQRVPRRLFLPNANALPAGSCAACAFRENLPHSLARP